MKIKKQSKSKGGKGEKSIKSRHANMGKRRKRRRRGEEKKERKKKNNEAGVERQGRANEQEGEVRVLGRREGSV